MKNGIGSLLKSTCWRGTLRSDIFLVSFEPQKDHVLRLLSSAISNTGVSLQKKFIQSDLKVPQSTDHYLPKEYFHSSVGSALRSLEKVPDVTCEHFGQTF